ncbi:MAG: DegT/DnrJ/EryC1/StrS family aminotransferase [Planctomycetes bacterium]|nr:DegT/DnrJ/EryC1/StrS family aminotransferase [Planctomycetota bacterium]
MSELLVAIASCSDAFELAPLTARTELGGLRVRHVWLGEPAELDAAVSLGLPRHAVDTPPSPGQGGVVLLAGHGQASQQFALRARHAGATVVRWNAGQRSHAPGEDDERRLTDHLANSWLCSSDVQLQELRREGCDAARIHVVGSLLPAALARLAERPAPAAPTVWLALEHRASVADAAALARLLQRVVDASAGAGLGARASATVLGPALKAHHLALPGPLQLAAFTPLEQLHAALDARVLITDSAGHQELAAVAGVPCILLRAATARPETVLAGASTLVGPDADLAVALAAALRRAPAHSPYADAMLALPQALSACAAPTATGSKAAPAKSTALPSDGDHTGRTLGEDEVALAALAIRSGTLNSTRGTFVAEFERRFAAWQGSKHAIACANGSAAVHAALAAIDLQPGDEVVTTPITDMGALTPILYQGGVPVFADVDPRSKNVTAATIAAQCTERTRAIVVTHLFGLPAELDAITQFANDRGIAVIEDCAQAFGATTRGRKVGTWGRIAAFSLQQGKHITCGEGGVVTTDDEALARRVFLFVNKAWGYGDPRPDHYFPALNYRLTELQGAVLVAQLGKLDAVIDARRRVAAALRAQLEGLPGLDLPRDPEGGAHVFWKFAIDVDPAVVAGGAVALGKGLQEQGIACAPRYVQKPAFACELFRDWRRFAVTSMPLLHNPRGQGDNPWPAAAELVGTAEALDRVLVLPINERYLPQHIDRVAAAIRQRHAELTRG